MHRMHRTHVNGFLFGLPLWLVLVSHAWGAQPYHWETIDIARSGTSATSIHGLNAQGDLVGTYGTFQGFLIPHEEIDPLAASEHATTFTDLGTSDPQSINSQGQVVGFQGSPCNGFLYQQGTLTAFCIPGSRLPLGTKPASINDAGQIAGVYGDSRTASPVGFRWEHGQGDSFALPWGALTLQPTGINEAGVIVGWYLEESGATRGFRKEGDTVTRFDRPGHCCTVPTGINDDGVIVGYTEGSPTVMEPIESFVYDNGIFETVDFPGMPQTTVRGINAVGQLVGDYVDTNGVGHGFLATPQAPTLPPVTPPAFTLVLSVIGDFNGDGWQDLAGLDAQGNIWVNLTFSAGWRNIPGHLDTLVVGDFDGDGRDDLAGLQTTTGSIWYLTNLQTWHWIPGRLDTLVAGDFNGDGTDDLAGLQTADGSIWLTTNKQTWQFIPGFLRTLGVQPLAGGLDSLFGYQGPCWWLWAAGVWYQSSCPG